MIKAERGYLIPAINTEKVDYERCANLLADSIRAWHPDADITIVTRDMIPDPAPGFAVDVQAVRLSPYRQTIKLEADMLCTSPIDHWWTMFEHRDVVISQGARNFYDEVAESRHYRRVFDVNGLPDVYNAVTYWRVSQGATDFWRCVAGIFADWTKWKTLLKFPDEEPSTDLVYAMAAQILGPETVTIPASYPKITHMKKHINYLTNEDWREELVWEYDGLHLKINTVAQTGLFHYHAKDWEPR